MADHGVDTGTQRPATGLDAGARQLLVQVVGQVTGCSPPDIVGALFHDRFGGYRDYLDAVETVWDAEIRDAVEGPVEAAHHNADTFGGQDADQAAAWAFLLHCPEPDFRLAIAVMLRRANRMEVAAERITTICRARGIPWAFSYPEGFEFVGDENVERDLTRPARTAVDRPEFSGGVKTHFESARRELAVGTPSALSQALVEAGSAVESAMMVVLDAHGAAAHEATAKGPL